MIYSKENLENQKFFEQIKNRAQDMMVYDQIHEASALITSLEKVFNENKDFKDKNNYLYVEYEKIIIRLKWLILPILADDEVVELFKNHFTEIYRMPDYELWRKLKSFLLGFIIFEHRDEFKKSLRQALLNNQEKLTAKELLTNNQKKIPTVGNWILDYNSNLGVGPVDNLKRIQYFTNNNNIKILSEPEKGRVKTLFDLYEKLKLSSFTLDGLEEDIPVDEDDMQGIIRGGVFEPYKDEKIPSPVGKKTAPPVKSKTDNDLAELKQLALSYPPGSLERKAVEEEIERMNKE